MPRDDVELSCELQAKPEYLHIDYEIANRAPQGAYVYLLPTDAKMEAHHHQTYAALSHNRRVLYLVVDIPPMPVDAARMGRRPIVPLARYIKPEDSYRDRFMLYYPVREWNGYAVPDTSSYGGSYAISHAVLSLAYVHESDAGRVERSTVPDFYEVDSEHRRKLVTTLRLSRPIPVQARLDGELRMTF